jgi:hypothetical protein
MNPCAGQRRRRFSNGCRAGRVQPGMLNDMRKCMKETAGNFATFGANMTKVTSRWTFVLRVELRGSSGSIFGNSQ